MASNQLRFIRRTLYRLKRRYGAKIEYYRTTSTVDESTGVRVEDRTKYDIRKAIRLPVQLLRVGNYESSFLTANRNFVYGATYDTNAQIFIIDAKDLAIVPNVDDYIIIEQSRFNVEEVEKLDYNAGYMLKTNAVEGDTLGRVINQEIDNAINFQSEVTHGNTS